MPSPSSFKKLFRIDKGQNVGQYTIDSIKVGHKVKTPYQRYEFPLKINFSLKDEKNIKDIKKDLLHAIHDHIKGEKIIYSAFGSPYECHFGTPKIIEIKNNEIQIKSTGYAIRRRDIPTKRELLKKRKRDPEVNEEELKEYKIIESRFSSSECDICKKQIEPGERIAKLKKDKTKGHWSHVECVFREFNPKKKRKT